ncbi:Dynein-1-beta heavy chain, flagellar inner arm I1 complex [Rhizoctonia solani]|uniref:Dynein-1-beta heavy chain, flagellar inner arm I1 complex n=1 Tax=Rhizoctonia solani TaxID=456999 RepID=A0A0K6G346_9AGAM|nr:Dynein-1-beta heavy chain, flagellar inner arm I1 complex [Rhizoctonia solani]
MDPTIIRELNEIDEHAESIPGAFSHPSSNDELALMLCEMAEADGFHEKMAFASSQLTVIPKEDEMFSAFVFILWILHRIRFKKSGHKGDIDNAIKFQHLALSVMHDGGPQLPEKLGSLAESHMDRFEHFGELEDIDKVIEYTSIAVEIGPKDNLELPAWLEQLGGAYWSKFRDLGELDDLERAIESQSRAVTLTPHDHPTLSTRLANLGLIHRDRFKRLGELGDLEKEIKCESQALSLTPDSDPNLSIILSNLGTSHQHRFERLGKPDDLDKAIEYESHVVALTPPDHPSMSARLATLGGYYGYRFKRLGKLDDLKEAMEFESQALSLTPDDHPDLSIRLSNLGLFHSQRFQRLGESHRHRSERLSELDDLEKAIECQSQAVALTPDGHLKLPSFVANLGVSHISRFKRLGGLDDLEKAIECESHAVVLTPDGHPALPFFLTNLGVSHRHRFERLSELEDLEKAIHYQSRAIALTPDGHPGLSSMHSNLGGSHKYRFERLGELNDLEQSIKHDYHALKSTSHDHPNSSMILSNVGYSLNRRFECLGKLDDLEKAIKCQSRAVSSTPHDHPDLLTFISNLGALHGNRFKRLCELDDLEKAIECQSRAIDLAPHGHPKLSGLHSNHALSYMGYHQVSGQDSHLQQALYSFRSACAPLSGAPVDRFGSARMWANWASKYKELHCIEAYQTAIDLLPQFIWLGATTDQRYLHLKSTSTLATQASRAAVLSCDYPLALEWLEHTRCVVWNQSLMLRSPLDQLALSHPSLSAQLQDVASQLNIASSDSRTSRVSVPDSMILEQVTVAQRHGQLAQKYDRLLAEVRTLPGFESFLCPAKSSELVCAARNGPIIVLTCHTDGCDALVILPDQNVVKHLPLLGFTHKKARDASLSIRSSLNRRGLRSRGRGVHTVGQRPSQDNFESALKMLWTDLVKPVLDFLGYLDQAPTNSLPHITWCPTGAASFLPIHAAGDYDQPHSRIFDFVVSSYTPTLSALLATTPTILSNDSQVLTVGQAATKGFNPLPGTTAELKCIESHIRSRAKCTQLIDDQATPLAVLDAMEKHDWVHLACHAHQNVYDATKSGFFLHEGTLDLATINQRTLKKKGLAFLSACQTATGDEELPDEAVHLASGMLMAGYSSVIATMWSVDDEDASFVADKVYSQLMEYGKLGNGEAGRALHDAVAGLRDGIGDETEDDDPEDAIMIISYMPTLDPNVESNTLPFILQNYAIWVTRRSFEPLKLTNISRDFVFSHFEASFESRWALVLLANIGGTIGRTGGLEQTHMSLLSALHDSVSQRITSAGDRDESTKALDLALEAIWMHFFVSPIPQAEKLRRAVAPIFRRLYPDPLVNLHALKDQPFCLRFYAYVDILLGGSTGFPMTFRYYASPALEETQSERSAHWIVGVPDRLIALFARMHALREDGSLPSPELVSELEGVIRGLRPILSESTNSFLCVTRVMVQECWRQVAYIYLYMGVCGESSEEYRVKRAMKQFMTLVKGTKPGRFPDEYLGVNYMMAAPAARLSQDRQILISRLLGQCGSNRESGITDNLKIIEDYWARADAEARPVVWSDVIISRIRVVGM